MGFKDLLVHLDGSRPSAHRLDYAIAWAARDRAHLTALYTLDLVPTLAELARGYPGRVEHFETYAKVRTAELARAKETEAHFREALRRSDLQGEWRFVEGLPAETVALHARYADLTIVGQIDPEHPPAGTGARIVEEVLFTSGRPVLIVPYAGNFPTLGQHAVIGWKATREAARALGDALPALAQAAKVTVVTVNPDRGSDTEEGIPPADIALHLARHGLRAEATTTIADDIATPDALLNYVADSAADLLVMGGYGHTRAREAMFGGVTRQILQHMTVPVLMAH